MQFGRIYTKRMFEVVNMVDYRTIWRHKSMVLENCDTSIDFGNDSDGDITFDI